MTWRGRGKRRWPLEWAVLQIAPPALAMPTLSPVSSSPEHALAINATRRVVHGLMIARQPRGCLLLDSIRASPFAPGPGSGFSSNLKKEGRERRAVTGESRERDLFKMAVEGVACVAGIRLWKLKQVKGNVIVRFDRSFYIDLWRNLRTFCQF